MDLEVLVKNLALAEQQLLDCRERIARQEARLAELRSADKSVSLATAVLMTMKRLQDQYILNRARLIYRIGKRMVNWDDVGDIGSAPRCDIERIPHNIQPTSEVFTVETEQPRLDGMRLPLASWSQWNL